MGEGNITNYIETERRDVISRAAFYAIPTRK
jgi:hypothetical protein